MCIALVITNILKYGIKEFREGFEGTEDEDKEKETEKETSKESIVNKNEDKPKPSDKKPVDKKATATELKDEFGEFTDIQEKINEGMQKMEPLLDKADSFIQKYEHLLKK